MKLVFLTAHNPLADDKKKWYSRLRFYSDTIVKLAESFECSSIDVVYHHTNFHNGASIEDLSEDETVVLDEFSTNPESFENCNDLYKLSSAKSIDVKFMNINKFLESNEDQYLVLFGILNGWESEMRQILDSYEGVIRKSNGYYYLSSDAELSSHQYIVKGRVGFLSMYPNLDEIYHSKLIGMILTEITDPGILEAYKSVGIDKSMIYYLPMIVHTSTRINPTDPDMSKKNNSIMMLRNFDQWMKYEELLESISGHFDIYESSMPTVRKKYISTVEKYSGYYKHARYWLIWKMKEILSGYRYYLGMSTPGSDRFTYKIIEATDAGTVCILPKLTLNEIGVDENFISQELLKEYSDIMILDVSNESNFRESLKSLKSIFDESDEDYMNRYNRQKEFIYKYFDYDSDNVNECVKLIKKGYDDNENTRND